MVSPSGLKAAPHLEAQAHLIAEPPVDSTTEVEAVLLIPAGREEVRVAAGDERLDFVHAGPRMGAGNTVEGNCDYVEIIILVIHNVPGIHPNPYVLGDQPFCISANVHKARP